MTILNKDATVVSAAMTDAFGADVPTTQAGLEKEADQTGIFIFSKTNYDLYLKNAAGAWVEYGNISGTRESITIPWGSNSAAFFKCSDATATMHVHRKTGDILYDATPENDGDDQNTLLTSAGSAAQDAQNYTFPAADGNANQVLTTDGSGTVAWADGGAGASTKVELTTSNLTLDSSYNGGVVVIEDLSSNMLIKLPSVSTVGTGYQVKFMVAINCMSGTTLDIQTDDMNETIRGLISRLANGGSGFDTDPEPWARYSEGNGVDENENTLRMTKIVAGTCIRFYSDGIRWYTEGQIISAIGANEATCDFITETF